MAQHRTTRRHGDCYKVAADALLLGPLAKVAEARLVHGWPRLSRPPFVRFGHAWIEIGDVVLDASNGRSFAGPKELYYAIGRIEEGRCRRYTAVEATDWLLRARHYGPWERRGRHWSAAPLSHFAAGDQTRGGETP